MQRLDAGIPMIDKTPKRMALSPSQASSVNYMKAMEASTVKLRPTRITYTNLDKQKARDQVLYRQDDRWSNVMLENSKEERETEMRARI